MAKAKAAAVTKVKKKVWYTILAPKAQNSVVLGETYVVEPQLAVGRIIHASLKSMSDSIRDQSVYMKFKITHAEGQNLYTEINGYYSTPSSIKRLARRNTVRIDDSFVVVTKDEKKIRVKPVMITIHHTVRSICSLLQRALREYIAREAQKVTFEEFIQQLVTHQLHTGARKYLSRTYPLRAFEIKMVEYAREGKAVKATKDSDDGLPKKENEGATEGLTEAPQKKKKEKKKKTVSEEMMEEFGGAAESAEAEGMTQPQQAQEVSEREPVQQDTEEFGEEEKGQSLI